MIQINFFYISRDFAFQHDIGNSKITIYFDINQEEYYLFIIKAYEKDYKINNDTWYLTKI